MNMTHKTGKAYYEIPPYNDPDDYSSAAVITVDMPESLKKFSYYKSDTG